MSTSNFINRPETTEELENVTKQQIDNLTVEQMKYEARQRQEARSDGFYRKCKGDSNLFLVLMIYLEDESRHWEICDDRQAAYDLIKDSIEDIDLVESMVISESVSFADAISCASFLIHVLESGKIVDEGFDPRDYIPADYDIEIEEE